MDTTQDKNTFGYQWVRKSTGEFYRGIHTGSVEDNYAGSGSVFRDKYGGIQKTKCNNPDDWVRNVLFIGTREECLVWESLVVTEREVENPQCLNCVTGGQGSITYSQETKDKISNAKSGAVFSDEHRANLSKALKGHTPSEETKLKLAKASTGKRHTKETRDKISKARKGIKFSDEHKANMAKLRRRENLSEETLEKMRKASTGRKASEETLMKMREAQKERRAKEKLAKLNAIDNDS